ncbi:MAG: helicase-related protein [Clostridium sp.]
MRKKEKIIIDELKYAITKINNWYKADIKTLTVISSPYNSTFIFGQIMHCYLKEGKKVLYIWGKYREDRDLISRLRELNKFFTYSYISSGVGESNLNFINIDNMHKVEGEYDLVIFDDISSYSKVTKEKLKESSELLHTIGKRVIYYLLDSITPLGEKIEVSSIVRKKPFVEPRVLTTRINLNEDIPSILYEYLKWFEKENKKVIIYVPTEEALESSYDYYKNKLKLKGVKILKYSKKESNKSLSNVLKYKDKSIFIITNAINESLEETGINHVVILSAEDSYYSYKRLIYLCGELGKENETLPEFLLVCNEENETIESVKNRAREFNKKVWEKRLGSL